MISFTFIRHSLRTTAPFSFAFLTSVNSCSSLFHPAPHSLRSFIPHSVHRCRYAFHSFNYIPFTYVHYISLNFIPFHAASLLGLIQISLLQFISLLSFTHHHTIRVNLYFLLLIFFTLHFIDS